MNVRLTKAQKIKIANSDDVFAVMRQILRRENRLGRHKEHFWVIGLANNHQVLYIELVSLGSLTATIVEPMDVFSWALQKRCVRLILVHNHPSGALQPSLADKEITDRLIQVGRIVKIEILDHLIISEEHYYSFADAGVLEALHQSTQFVPRYADEERVRKASHVDMARKLKGRGVTVEVIIAVSGLTAEAVEAL